MFFWNTVYIITHALYIRRHCVLSSACRNAGISAVNFKNFHRTILRAPYWRWATATPVSLHPKTFPGLYLVLKAILSAISVAATIARTGPYYEIDFVKSGRLRRRFGWKKRALGRHKYEPETRPPVRLRASATVPIAIIHNCVVSIKAAGTISWLLLPQPLHCRPKKRSSRSIFDCSSG